MNNTGNMNEEHEPVEPGMRQLISVLNSENGIAQLLQEPAYAQGDSPEPTVSQAEVVADLVNVARLDQKAIAEAAGLDLEVNRMTPEYAALLLQRLIKRESLELIEVFNDLERQREAILAELIGEEQLAEHLRTKQTAVYSQPDPDPDEEMLDPPVGAENGDGEDVPVEDTDGDADGDAEVSDDADAGEPAEETG